MIGSFGARDVEMDCFQVFKAFTENYSCPNGYGLILDDCRVLAYSIGDIKFSFVRRSANTATHVVARVEGSLSGPGEWRHVLMFHLHG